MVVEKPALLMPPACMVCCVDRINRIKNKTLSLYFGGDIGESCGKLDLTNVSTSPAARMWGGVRRPCTRWPHGDFTSLLPGQHEKVWSSVTVCETEVSYEVSSLLGSFLSTWAHSWWPHWHSPSLCYLSATFPHSSPHSLLSTHPLSVLWRKIKRRIEINWGQSCSFTRSAPGQETLLITRLKMLLLQTENWVQAEFKWSNQQHTFCFGPDVLIVHIILSLSYLFPSLDLYIGGASQLLFEC